MGFAAKPIGKLRLGPRCSSFAPLCGMPVAMSAPV
jgi:hypothetical protein